MRRLVCAALSLALVLAFAATAGAAELAGAVFDDRVTIGDQALVLNGTGIRSKFFVKVYAAGLYLPARQSDAGRILAADQPRRTVLHFLYDVERQKMCDAWDDALAGNTPRASAQLKQRFATLCSAMDDVADGDRMVFTYLPGAGTTVEVAGRNKGTISGKDFADALWAAWIGPKPATKDLRAGLLGG
ncbi:MAG TPA: chalcone isomerase family protein [Thermoanaerobaculia bacterium]|nr:chalcone isomerase family protein [Thermoanaerobaculia bacterium]